MPPKPSGQRAPEVTDRPPVDVSGARPIYNVAADLVDRLVQRGDAFRRAGELVALALIKGRWVLRPVDDGRLLTLVGQVCDPVRLNAKGKPQSHIALPAAVVKVMLAWDGSPMLPIEGVTATPIVHPDGSLWAEEGYDPISRLWYAPPPGFILPPIPEEPTEAELAEAVAILDDALADFGLVGSADHANALALMLTIVVRPLAPLAPLVALDAPTPALERDSWPTCAPSSVPEPRSA